MCTYVTRNTNNGFTDSSITPLLGGEYPLKRGRGVVHTQEPGQFRSSFSLAFEEDVLLMSWISETFDLQAATKLKVRKYYNCTIQVSHSVFCHNINVERVTGINCLLWEVQNIVPA